MSVADWPNLIVANVPTTGVGGYRTEFYPTYDYRGLYAQLKKKMG